MDLKKRVEQLEQRGGGNGLHLIVISFSGADSSSKLGAEREFCRPVVGYRAMGDARHWDLEPGETAEGIKDRMRAELEAEGPGVFVVSECYAGGD